MIDQRATTTSVAWRVGAAAVVVVVVVGALAVVMRQGSTARASTHSVNVVAGENFWGDIIRQIGGDHVRVTSIITDPSTDPHLYESDAHDAGAIAEADLVIKNGLGYDDFLGKLIGASPNKGRQELTVSEVLHVTGDNPNPHLWYDLPRVPEVARAIERALAAKDPADARTFQANLDRFEGELQPAIALLNEIKTTYPGAPVAYTERVPGYLLAQGGLTLKTPAAFAQSIEEGNEPSPGDVDSMNSLMADHRVKVLLYNPQATSPVTQHVRDRAEQAGIPVVAVTETLPSKEKSFQSWQSHQLRALLRALENRP